MSNSGLINELGNGQRRNILVTIHNTLETK